jgi:hypothetical protein
MAGEIIIFSNRKGEARDKKGDKASKKCVSRTRQARPYKESPQNIEK